MNLGSMHGHAKSCINLCTINFHDVPALAIAMETVTVILFKCVLRVVQVIGPTTFACTLQFKWLLVLRLRYTVTSLIIQEFNLFLSDTIL